MDSPEIIEEVTKAWYSFRLGFVVKAVGKLKRLEEAGSGNAAYYLYLLYRDGFKCSFIEKLLGYGKIDELLANDYFTKSIERDSSIAQCHLACAYYYGDQKESGIEKEIDYVERYKWAVLCVNNPEYTPEAFIAMALLSELYANGLGCAEDYRHAVLLRTIADMYDSFVPINLGYVPKSFHISSEMESWAKRYAMAYFSCTKDHATKPRLALPILNRKNAGLTDSVFESTISSEHIVNANNNENSEESGKPEYITDEILIETSRLIVTALGLQISNAQSMSLSISDGEDRLKTLLSSEFFYGYVFGLCGEIASKRFVSHIDNHNLGKNIRRVVQSVIANLFYSDSEPDWDAVQAWLVQAATFGAAHNDDYEKGMNAGMQYGKAIITGNNSSHPTLLGAELLKTMQ